MTDTTNLSGLKLAELQQLASSLGVAGISKLRKGDLVAAIEAKRGDGAEAPAADSTPDAAVAADAPVAAPAADRVARRRAP